jgi:hypothetical protein
LKTRLYAGSLAVLVLGLCSAALIYMTADAVPESAAIEEMQMSKQYARELQRFGGKAAVLFDEFNRWFASLWHGKSLAVTLAWISIFVSLAMFSNY